MPPFYELNFVVDEKITSAVTLAKHKYFAMVSICHLGLSMPAYSMRTCQQAQSCLLLFKMFFKFQYITVLISLESAFVRQ